MKLPAAEHALSNEKSRWLPAKPQSSLWSQQGAVLYGFGFQAEAWETFAAALREHGQQHEVTLTKETGFGPRHEVEGELAARTSPTQVRTVWQQDAGQVAPRLITAYPLESL